ncbi:MAG: FAD-dependent oxidoreductase, partial [Deltaproteobacteria bacterium]|nr:FAD-dependent oxidoreductase [Deltaproteobacteria bacterium]
MPNRQSMDHGSIKQVLVVGGGVAGLSAARALEGWGARVHLVEKKAYPGGNAFEWACMATNECRNCGACLTGELVNDVERLENSRIYLETEINKIVRDGTRFQVELKGRCPVSLNVDAVILATGFEPFDPSSMLTLKYTKNDKVITTRDLNRIIRTERLPDFLNGNDVPRIAFIQCVGSRNREQGRDYCSQVCCKVALRQAEKILDLCPGAEISIFHMDLQVIGKEFRTGFGRIKDRVRILQGVPAEILTDLEPGSLTVFQERETDGERIAYHFDMMVLSVGMVPSNDSTALAKLFNIQNDQWGFFRGEGVSLGEGVYSAGTALGPVDILGAKQQGIIAAHRVAGDLGLLPDKGAAFSVCVIGGGPEGQRIGRELVSHGFRTVLVDNGYHDTAPGEVPEYLANARLTGVTRDTGKFTIKMYQGDEKRSVKADSIIVAPGSEQRQVPVPGLEYGKGNVIGLAEFLQRTEESSGDLPERVAFLLDYSGEEWKINTRNSLLTASRLAEQGKEVFVIMKKMLVNGLEGQKMYDLARGNNVRFLRVSEGYPPAFNLDGKSVEITLREATLGSIPITVRSDLLVIPDAILPSPDNPFLKHILNIDQDGEGLLQSANTRHRLVSSPRKGIFFFGTCHDETDENDLLNEINEIIADLDMIRDRHPAGSQAVAVINEKLCGRCLTCLRICPHGAVM